ncbi:MAG TPA: RlpA-like double-psi beta-barrel domain-containing protein [Chloroflexota bacterium]|nr:RlpA-like double-psi beta-barrel domain-containing protein [Chloroflexota bacterium]
MLRFIAALVLAIGLSASALPVAASGKAPADYPIPGGHFYSQANGTSQGPDGGGYALTNEGGIPFWTFYSQHGGVEQFGYPISRRFVWGGRVSQATQRAVLQWNPATNQVELANIFDYLSQIGKDDWLFASHLAPRSEKSPYEVQPLSFLSLAHYRFLWLRADPSFFQRYFDTPDYYAVYGLPTSSIQDFGSYTAIRFQRVVMYHWKSPVSWADSRGVSIGLAGDLFKDLGFVPSDALLGGSSPNVNSASPLIPSFSSPTRMTASPPASSPIHSEPVPVQPTLSVAAAAPPVTSPLPAMSVATVNGTARVSGNVSTAVTTKGPMVPPATPSAPLAAPPPPAPPTLAAPLPVSVAGKAGVSEASTTRVDLSRASVTQTVSVTLKSPRETVAVSPSPAPSRTLVQSEPHPVASTRLNRHRILQGLATWYGASFNGQTMSNGRPFDMSNPNTTAANVFSLGTHVRVTRLTTGQSIVVVVTDRGGFRYPDLLDLSYAAFARLADPSIGVIGIQVEALDDGD